MLKIILVFEGLCYTVMKNEMVLCCRFDGSVIEVISCEDSVLQGRCGG